MKILHRLTLVLMMVFSLSLLPLASAAGDPTTDGEVLSDGGPAAPVADPAPPAAVPGVSTPRVILSGFTTNPTEVQAGEDFQVTFTLHNTSKKTRVQNMKVTLASADAAFLPANGSSSLYLPRIGADQIESGTMNFHSLPSLEEKPYQLTIGIEYEDGQANAYSAQETVSIQVKQSIRADASAPQLLPPQLTMGQDASLTFSIFNQGKTKLYNAKASIAEGQAITGQEVFVGTIDAGASGAVDMTVQAVEEMAGPVTVTVSYEDVDGKVATMDKTVEVAVMAPMPMEEPGGWEEPMPEELAGGFPWVPTLVGAGLLALFVILALVVRGRRRRRAEAEDLESLAALGDPLIAPDAR
ncbi:hypothetical protein GCM10025789_12750 [Tessaracoccus lubricantis]|uniref:CARDB domain-containing protein n=1 Tax=Tessaracoccus lubricantis TaxID=545543 RepID=A0ABP9FF57_9ACTN